MLRTDQNLVDRPPLLTFTICTAPRRGSAISEMGAVIKRGGGDVAPFELVLRTEE